MKTKFGIVICLAVLAACSEERGESYVTSDPVESLAYISACLAYYEKENKSLPLVKSDLFKYCDERIWEISIGDEVYEWDYHPEGIIGPQGGEYIVVPSKEMLQAGIDGGIPRYR